MTRKHSGPLFDLAISSMDFGSGFMDDEEVELLRSFAVMLGVDPALATPSNFACKYVGGHKWRIPGTTSLARSYWVCDRCHGVATGDVAPPAEYHVP